MFMYENHEKRNLFSLTDQEAREEQADRVNLFV